MSTALPLPPMAILEAAGHDLAEQARSAGDASRESAMAKALMQISRGVQVVTTFGALLVESRTSTGQIYRVSHQSGCNCKAAQSGRICWHSALVDIITEAQARALPPLGQRLANARKSAAQAEAEMDELFA